MTAGRHREEFGVWWPDRGRATHAVVDLDAISANLGAVRRQVGDTQVIAVVKANAYGHGAVMVAETALAAGATTVAVSAVDEALELREAGIDGEILVLAPIAPSEYETAFRYRLIISVADPGQIAEAARAAGLIGSAGRIHLKVETGMNRYGVAPESAVDLASRIAAIPALQLAGTFTHLADADGPDLAFTEGQINRFSDVISAMTTAGIDPGLVHTANTAGTLRVPIGQAHAVRLGIGLYGLRPAPAVPLLPGMRAALSLRTRVAQTRDLKPGDTVSYGRTWVAERPDWIALLPVGYADGLRRGLSGQGWVIIGGERCAVRGRVCMDQVVVDRPSPWIVPGAEVTVIGDAATGAMTMDDVASLVGTINYEIATGIAHRVPRWYLRAGRPVAHLRGPHLTRVQD